MTDIDSFNLFINFIKQQKANHLMFATYPVKLMAIPIKLVKLNWGCFIID